MGFLDTHPMETILVMRLQQSSEGMMSLTVAIE